MIAIQSPIYREDDLICCDLPELEFSRTYDIWEAWKLRIDIKGLPVPLSKKARLLGDLDAELRLFELEVAEQVEREERREINFVVPFSLLCLAVWILVCLWVA